MKKRILFTVVLALILMCMLMSCKDAALDFSGTLPNEEEFRENVTDSKNGNVIDTEDNTINDNIVDELGVFDKYDVTKIYPFHNGLAMFVVSNKYCGYIDIYGNVVIEPKYYEARGEDSGIQGFKYGCARLYNGVSIHYIFDKEGNKVFSGSIGEVSGGYFSIKETKSYGGYTLTYYRASDFQIVATFEDCIEEYPVSAYTGDFYIYDINEDTTISLNISNYDTSFQPEIPPALDFDIEQHETYKHYAYSVYWIAQTQNGIIATVYSSSSNGNLSSIVKSDGTVLLEPQTKIRIIGQFSNELCIAQDTETKKYGYIDVYGNWKIQPIYTSGMVFNDGYAIVDEIIVIDTIGKVVLSPDG